MKLSLVPSKWQTGESQEYFWKILDSEYYIKILILPINGKFVARLWKKSFLTFTFNIFNLTSGGNPVQSCWLIDFDKRPRAPPDEEMNWMMKTRSFISPVVCCLGSISGSGKQHFWRGGGWDERIEEVPSYLTRAHNQFWKQQLVIQTIFPTFIGRE